MTTAQKPRQPISGDQIKAARKELEVTQAELAALLSTSRSLISTIEINQDTAPRSVEFALTLVLTHFRLTKGQLKDAESLKHDAIASLDKMASSL